MNAEPPIPLSIAERKTYDAYIDRIRSEGRLHAIDHTLLATFCQTLDLYLQCLEEIRTHGVLVRGRTEKELVRSPALTPLNQARDAMIKLARAVPLVNPRPDLAGVEIDKFLEEIMK